MTTFKLQNPLGLSESESETWNRLSFAIFAMPLKSGGFQINLKRNGSQMAVRFFDELEEGIRAICRETFERILPRMEKYSHRQEEVLITPKEQARRDRIFKRYSESRNVSPAGASSPLYMFPYDWGL